MNGSLDNTLVSSDHCSFRTISNAHCANSSTVNGGVRCSMGVVGDMLSVFYSNVRGDEIVLNYVSVWSFWSFCGIVAFRTRTPSAYFHIRGVVYALIHVAVICMMHLFVIGIVLDVFLLD